jgi:hypothetical protein
MALNAVQSAMIPARATIVTIARSIARFVTWKSMVDRVDSALTEMSDARNVHANCEGVEGPRVIKSIALRQLPRHYRVLADVRIDGSPSLPLPLFRLSADIGIDRCVMYLPVINISAERP